jgi:hypothetical protein
MTIPAVFDGLIGRNWAIVVARNHKIKVKGVASELFCARRHQCIKVIYSVLRCWRLVRQFRFHLRLQLMEFALVTQVRR